MTQQDSPIHSFECDEETLLSEEEGIASEEEEPKRKFRINGAQLALTYAQCYIHSTEEVLVLIKQICDEKEWVVDKYIVALEFHESGEPHYHVYLKFTQKVNITRQDTFDLKSEDAIYHPNMQSCRSEKSWSQYCKKEGDYISNFYKASVYTRMLEKTITTADAMLLLQQEDPRSYCLYGEQIERNVKKSKKELVAYHSTYTTFPNLPGAMKSWVDCELQSKTRAKCLILIGPSRLGKTEWARSLGKHMYWQSMFNIEKWDDTAQYMIFDDIPWQFIPHKKALLGCKGETELTDKYHRKITVMNNKPAIILMNDDEDSCEFKDDDYWRQNSVVVRLYSKLF